MKTQKSGNGLSFERDELIGIFVSIVVATFFFVVLRYDVVHSYFGNTSKDTKATATSTTVQLDTTNDMNSMVRSLNGAVTSRGEVTKLIIEDTKVGKGKEVKKGSRVTLNYIGTLRGGEQFDNSYAKGEPYSFTVGGGTVIEGWDIGLLGMKEGGERILVVPPNLAYGDRAIGIVPKNATLLFLIEFLKVE